MDPQGANRWLPGGSCCVEVEGGLGGAPVEEGAISLQRGCAVSGTICKKNPAKKSHSLLKPRNYWDYCTCSIPFVFRDLLWLQGDLRSLNKVANKPINQISFLSIAQAANAFQLEGMAVPQKKIWKKRSPGFQNFGLGWKHPTSLKTCLTP